MKLTAAFVILSIYYGYFFQFSEASVNCGSSDSSEEAVLKRKLFCHGYDETLRPVKNYTKTTNIDVTMYLKSYDFSDSDSTLTINVWLRTSWTDEFLTWDPPEHGGIKSVDIGSDMIWKGDFSLYNADLSFGLGSCHLTNCLMESDGTMTCVEPCTFKAHCKADYVYWPFDQQNCTMTYGPWMNADKEIDYSNQSSYMTQGGAAEHSKWKMISSRSYKKVTQIRASNSSVATIIPTLSFSFLIERHSGMIIKVFTGNVMILVTINILSLLLKPEKKERLMLIAVNVYLHFQVIHQLSWTIPSNGDKSPYAMVFISDSLIMTAVIFIVTMIVNWLSSSERTPFDWMTKLLMTIKNKKFDFLILHANDADQKILIDEEPTTAEEVLAAASEDPKPKNNSIWRNIAAIFDLTALVLICICYAIICVTLIPQSYMKNNFPMQVVD